MMLSLWRRWLQRIVGTKATRQPIRRHRPALEQMEDRMTPAVTANVAGNVLTITGTFADTVVLTSAAGNVKVNGADPTPAVTAANTILQVFVNVGPGTNLVDLPSNALAAYTGLLQVSVNGGAGNGTIKFDPTAAPNLASATIDVNNQPYLVEIAGTTTDVTANFVTDQIILPNPVVNTPNSGPSNLLPT